MKLFRTATLLAACALSARAALAQDFVPRRWLLLGPVPALHPDSGVAHDYLGAEPALRPDSGEGAAGLTWMPAEADSTGTVDLLKAIPGSGDWSVAYAAAYLFAARETTAALILDSDDDIEALLNGQRVWLNVIPRGVGNGADTAVVRLAAGWNTVILKIRNRSGGFGMLARVAPVTGAEPLEGMRSQAARPAELAAGHHLPASTIILSPLKLQGALTWNGGSLEARSATQLSAWGGAPLRNVTVRIEQGTARWEPAPAASPAAPAGDTIAALEPGRGTTLAFMPSAEELRRAVLGGAPLQAVVSWAGGTRTIPLAVDADGLLRLLGNRIALGTWIVDSTGQGARLEADLVVPAALSSQPLDLLTAEFGPNAGYQVNGRTAQWRGGAIDLCGAAGCWAGDSLRIVVRTEPGRPRWSFPTVRTRDPGYREYADGYGFAQLLAGAAPAIARPDPREWLAALGNDTAYRGLTARYRAAYAPLAARIRQDTLHLVGNSHIDAAWLWPWSETIDVIRRTWRSSLRIASAFPGYVFAASAAAYFDAMDRYEPTLADSLTVAVRDGTFALVGGWWVEPDQNLPIGESLVRQGLYGQRYFQHRFGRRAHVGWTPDSFGYPWTLPQIYRGVGLDAFVTQKIRWNDSTKLPYNAFFWEGRDGTRLFTYNPYGYDHDLDLTTLAKNRVDDRTRPGATHHMMVLYGVGDHGGGPTIEMMRRAEDGRRIPTFPVMQYDNPDHALGVMRSSAGDSTFPVWNDELYLEYHRATFTTQSAMKRRVRRSESMLRTAEALASLDTAAYPRAQLTGAWHRVLFNQFHDILPGSGIHQIYVDANANYDSAWATIDSVSARAFGGLRMQLDTRATRRTLTPVVVFNPLTWTRSGYVTIAGARDSTPVFVPDVPALGARVVYLDRAAHNRLVGPGGARLGGPAAAPRAGSGWMENAFLRVAIDTATGTITHLVDRRTRRDAIAPGGRANTLTIWDDLPAEWDAWNLEGYLGKPHRDVDSVVSRRFAVTAEAATYTIVRAWGASTFTQTLVLSRGRPWLDVRNSVEWHETHKLLKAGFALAGAPDSLTCEIPYGTIGRTGAPRTQAERAKYEFPCQRWVDASDSSGGAAIFTDSKYGWDYQGRVPHLSLLRAPTWPDSLADRGHQEFRFAIYPHAGDWRTAAVERHAAEYNTPLVASVEAAHAGALGRSTSLASVDAPNVEITWVKRAEDSNALVLRLVEWHGRPATATVTLRDSVASARRANLLEDPGEALPVSGRSVTIQLRPYEIATILVDTNK